MVFNTETKIKQLTGETLKDQNGKEVTVKSVLIDSLSAPLNEEKGEVKFKKYSLAQKIYETDEVELTAEDVSLIKELVGKMYAPIVVGFIWNFLEGKIKDEEETRQ